MKKTKCLKCGKVIEGYTERHIEYLLDQHLLVHKYKKETIKEEINKVKQDGNGD